MSSRNDYLTKYKGKLLTVYLTNGVTLCGKINTWDDEDFIISGFDREVNEDVETIVSKGTYISITNKKRGKQNGKR
jgi:sRNA-binding regulator protein Hfq